MNTNGRDEQQHDRRKQRSESLSAPESELKSKLHARAGAIRNRIIIILLVLLLVGAGWYSALQRQVVILTDPLWKTAYLDPEHTVEQLKITLLNRFYISKIVTVPFEHAGQAALEELCRSQKGAWFILSPYLSTLITPSQLLQACPDSNFVVWEHALESGLEGDGAEQPSPEPSRMTFLYLDPEMLAEALAEGLEPPGGSTENGRKPIQLVWSGKGRFSKEFALRIHAELTALPSKIEVRLIDLSEPGRSEPEITSQSLVAVIDGEASELRGLLTRVENRGARAVVFGDGALSGWPAGVEAEISMDIKTTLLEILKGEVREPKGSASTDAAAPPEKGGESSGSTEAKALFRRFAVRFQVSR